MKSFHIPRTALFFILFALAAFAVLYHPIDLKALVRASSQGTLRTEEVAHFGSTNDMDYHSSPWTAKRSNKRQNCFPPSPAAKS